MESLTLAAGWAGKALSTHAVVLADGRVTGHVTVGMAAGDVGADAIVRARVGSAVVNCRPPGKKGTT